MKFEGWYLLLGALMLAVTLLDQWVKRLPITTTIVYLLLGAALGPLGLNLIALDAVRSAGFLERVTELAVIVSLFTAGLKLRSSLRERRWRVPLRLAFLSMTVTVGLVGLAGVFLLNLPLGAAVLLGAVLAPTDPVLASDVQLEHPGDRDQLRFSLTGEAGFNDGAAFPFVMLGLGLLGAHEIGAWGWRWVAVDLVWAIAGGIGIGWALGTMVRKMAAALRRAGRETVSREEFLALGLIGASYGLALLAHTYGFLAVFAAGLSFSRIEEPSDAPKLSHQVLQSNEQFERLLEIGLVLLLGGMLSSAYLTLEALGMAALLFFLIRPLAVITCVSRKEEGAGGIRTALLSWFGIRGIGSLYYLMFAINRGVDERLAPQLTGFVLSAVAASILLHGISVTPIMTVYERRCSARRHSA